MSEKRSIIDPNETILWKGKPDKKAYVLPALKGSLVLFLGLGFLTLILILEASLLESQAIIVIPFVFAFVMLLPPLWQLRKYPTKDYIITNQRLIIQRGFVEPDEFIINLDEIKEVLVKISSFDKRLSTGSIYPITDLFPYEPGKYPAPSGEHQFKMITVYNLVEQKYETISEKILWEKCSMHPRLEGLKEPYVVEKILKSAMLGEATFVNCRYCHTHYDSEKEGKCPHCGGTQPKDYSTV